MINFQYVRPSTTQSALDAFARTSNSKFIAGGTNLIDLMKRGVTAPEKLIDINRLPLSLITEADGITRIGALALNSTVSEDPIILKKHPLLSLALKAGASAQLRNMATVGGNMMQRTRCPYFYDTSMPCNKREPGSGCSAIGGYNRMHAIFGTSEKCIAVHPSDMCVALVALDTTVNITGKNGNRSIPFSNFHRLPGEHPENDNTLQPGELITGVDIKNDDFTRNVSYLKIRDRASYAFALVSVAAALSIQGGKIKSCRLAMGGVAHKPWRLLKAEKFLEGKDVSQQSFAQAAALEMTDAKGYGYNNFKLKMAPNAIIEALTKASSGI